MKFVNKSTALLPVIILSGLISFHAASAKTSSNADNSLYSWTENPSDEAQRVEQAEERLKAAIANPEYMLKNWIELPTSPESKKKTRHQLTIREAILLALRYNPNIQNAELDRIIQRYQLRLANNEFELQYALGASGVVQKSTFEGIGSSTNHSFLASPELDLKTKIGTKASVSIDNNVSTNNSYNPVLNLSITQPLLRGFGKSANEAKLLDAIDKEWLNKLSLQQSVMDQITQVITAYRALILSGNNLENQRLQLEEARKSYRINEKKIAAGQLEPTGNIQQSYQIESLSLMVEQGENDFKLASQELLQMIGLDPDLHISVPSDVTIQEIIVPDLQESIAIALSHNTQYLAQKMALRADERAYTVAKNQQLWQLDLAGTVQGGAVNDVTGTGNGLSSIYNGNNITESARVTLTIPLNDIGRRSQLINAKVQLEKDKINLIAAKRALITSVTNTINNIQSLAKRYELAQKQVKLAEQSYALEKKKQQAGISSALDVNNTQNQLIQAQSGLIGAKIAYLNQLSALQRILGTTLDYWQIKLRYGG
ncbi:type I secretion outer membrane protein%2C TolC family [Legionella pneumophila]|uniref:TolC family protein n=1 Tax=Legionella pneumophila TaxID=446 RepID=UPI0005C96275|nr:TolC family protein [Legionella pneumophila]HAT8828382.1 TolC family protein [Legionella pneumophila subsp. pneumophila]WAI79157.1 TolC family protein [Legionella pneumophila]CZH05842.1 type I secretion outer membrane protein%2C TolC family [Legionella pneumophila]CZI26524.1 type I secretion outer membrane protein%2C TolC family [Legionella pneumophila]HAT4693394.1 TolC family protein [Legionella pneumophila]